jgi:hypothetical protein
VGYTFLIVRDSYLPSLDNKSIIFARPLGLMSSSVVSALDGVCSSFLRFSLGLSLELEAGETVVLLTSSCFSLQYNFLGTGTGTKRMRNSLSENTF